MLLSQSMIFVSALFLPGPAGGTASFDQIHDFAPRSVSFDDRPGKGFEWTKRLPCGANRATVTVKFEKTYSGPTGRQMPVGKIWLHSGEKDEPSEQWIAAVLKAPTDSWKLDALTWLEKVTDTKSESAGGYAPADLTRPLQITFAWTRDGVIDVDFGGEFVKRVVTDKPITSIGLGGSWSKFEFVDLKVGREGPPDAACDAPRIANSVQTPPKIEARDEKTLVVGMAENSSQAP